MGHADAILRILGGEKTIATKSPRRSKKSKKGRGEVSRRSMIRLIREGLSYRAADRVRRYYGLSDTQFRTLLGFSPRTLARREAAKKPLTPAQSDRVYRLARVGAHAEEVFADADTARDWLAAPNRALNSVSPLDLLDTDVGTEQVEEVLLRIEYGVFG